MSGARIEVRSAARAFDTDAGVVRALDGVSFDLPAGESMAVTGPSGCGKSTLLALLGALDQATAGSVRLDGVDLAEVAEVPRAALRRSRIGFVFQADNLQPFLTATENVALALALAGREGDVDRVPGLMRSLGIERLGSRLPDQLSGGERQRVAVARALVHQPGLILADEPTGALDGDNARAVVDLLLQAHSETGATLVIITHDEGVADRFERRLALQDGRARPDDRETARA